jgi:hypothetical protein
MKMGEYELWMTELSAVSGLSREILDRSNAQVLFALRNVIVERDSNKMKVEKLARDLRRHLPGDMMLHTMLTELGFES